MTPMRIPMRLLALSVPLMLSASVDRTQSKLADRYHKHQRELQAVTEEWIAYCKSIDKVLQMGAGEPWCVVAAPTPPQSLPVAPATPPPAN